MSVHHHRIRFAEHLDLGAGAHPGPSLDLNRPWSPTPAGLHLVCASGRAVQLDLPSGWLSLWLPLQGALRLEAADSAWDLAPGHLQVWRDGRVRSGARGPCWWLCLCGPEAAWKPHLAGAPQALGSELFPWEGVAARDARRLLVRLARLGARPAELAVSGPTLLRTLAELLREEQRELLERLARCSGRTLRRRQQTLLRLLRVQHLIRRHPDVRLDLGRLARSASYSPCHLIRIYRDVFDETPTEYAARLRSDRAWRMVRDTRMPVCEITEALGFESQSAFCRAFKNSFGVTATQARRAEGARLARGRAA
ncbi:helix-turn-helix domain-containing protein [Lysobacter enzymogenes]|uniref:helix-turn-helix domain-containing protein n=1 Tax=Lysobacter enzymogenes TaxID=69 RepID=UPI00099BB832|nr:AraC family transcriptional regulator [Lysobacter enzymogenes]UZW62043.1 AraC family transcriptional regulator [Lysobacter enzymogenes]